MIPEPDDNDPLTDDDLKAAQARWADPQHEASATELFARPVYGDGFRGDAPLERGGEPLASLP